MDAIRGSGKVLQTLFPAQENLCRLSLQRLNSLRSCLNLSGDSLNELFHRRSREQRLAERFPRVLQLLRLLLVWLQTWMHSV